MNRRVHTSTARLTRPASTAPPSAQSPLECRGILYRVTKDINACSCVASGTHGVLPALGHHEIDATFRRAVVVRNVAPDSVRRPRPLLRTRHLSARISRTGRARGTGPERWLRAPVVRLRSASSSRKARHPARAQRRSLVEHAPLRHARNDRRPDRAGRRGGDFPWIGDDAPVAARPRPQQARHDRAEHHQARAGRDERQERAGEDDARDGERTGNGPCGRDLRGDDCPWHLRRERTAHEPGRRPHRALRPSKPRISVRLDDSRPLRDPPSRRETPLRSVGRGGAGALTRAAANNHTIKHRSILECPHLWRNRLPLPRFRRASRAASFHDERHNTPVFRALCTPDRDARM